MRWEERRSLRLLGNEALGLRGLLREDRPGRGPHKLVGARSVPNPPQGLLALLGPWTTDHALVWQGCERCDPGESGSGATGFLLALPSINLNFPFGSVCRRELWFSELCGTLSLSPFILYPDPGRTSWTPTPTGRGAPGPLPSVGNVMHLVDRLGHPDICLNVIPGVSERVFAGEVSV